MIKEKKLIWKLTMLKCLILQKLTTYLWSKAKHCSKRDTYESTGLEGKEPASLPWYNMDVHSDCSASIKWHKEEEERSRNLVTIQFAMHVDEGLIFHLQITAKYIQEHII